MGVQEGRSETGEPMAEARGWQGGRRPVDRFDDRRPLRRDASPPDKSRAALDEPSPWQHPQVMITKADHGASDCGGFEGALPLSLNAGCR